MTILSTSLACADVADTFRPSAQEQERLAAFSRSPQAIIESLQGPRELVDGQLLDPKLQYYLEARRRQTPEQRGLAMFDDPQGRVVARNILAREWALFTKVTAPMRKVEDRQVAGPRGPVPIRIYTPDVTDHGPLPILIYFHGGGWLYSGIEAVDRCVRLIANEARAIVINVEYGLAPENPWPAAIDDGEEVYLWALKHAAELGGSAGMIAVGGDSAGGRLSLTLSQRQIDAGRPKPLLQLLYYTAGSFSPDQPSAKLFANGYGLDMTFLNFMTPRVYQGAGTAERSAKQMREMKFSQMPATIVVTAGFDVLRDSGLSLARQLEKNAVAVTHLHYPTLIHGFLQWSGVVADAERAAVDTARLFGTAMRSRVVIAPPPGTD